MAMTKPGAWQTWRTARRRHRCDQRQWRVCIGLIDPGERYLRTALAPGRDLGNTGWLNANLCPPCAALAGHTDPRAEMP